MEFAHYKAKPCVIEWCMKALESCTIKAVNSLVVICAKLYIALHVRCVH